jgi:hypothetical protein
VFSYCRALTGVYFEGNAPSFGLYVFDHTLNAIIYYLPGKTGWDATFGVPTALWSLPVTLTSSFAGVWTNQFGFTITAGNVPAGSNLVVVVEACTDPANSSWSPVGTNTLTNGSSYFSDPTWTNYPIRLYRLHSK